MVFTSIARIYGAHQRVPAPALVRASFVSLAMSIVYLGLTRWDVNLLPKLAAMLAVFQLSHLAAAVIRAWWYYRWERGS